MIYNWVEMANKKLDSLLDFVKFTHLLQKVTRVIRVNGENRWENDAEHTFQVALVAWFVIEQGKLDLDLNKVLLMSLAHDLVEAYAGDTYIYDHPEVLAGKKDREEEAAKLLQKNFPGFSSLGKIIAEYEATESAEAKFVYALDKLLPILNIYLDEGRTWKEKSINFQQIYEVKTPKIAISSEIYPFYEEIMAVLKNNPYLFEINL